MAAPRTGPSELIAVEMAATKSWLETPTGAPDNGIDDDGGGEDEPPPPDDDDNIPEPIEEKAPPLEAPKPEDPKPDPNPEPKPQYVNLALPQSPKLYLLILHAQ